MYKYYTKMFLASWMDKEVAEQIDAWLSSFEDVNKQKEKEKYADVVAYIAADNLVIITVRRWEE